MGRLGIELVQWHGREVYAKQGEWLVKFNGQNRTGANGRSLIESLDIGAMFKRALGDEWAVVRFPLGGGYEKLQEQMGARKIFSYAEPNLILRPQATYPSDWGVDPDSTLQWGLHNAGQDIMPPDYPDCVADVDIDAPEAWDLTTGSEDVIVAVIDVGVDWDHDDLADNMWVNPGEIADDGVDNDGNGYIDDVHGYDFADDDGDPDNQTEPHGTHVAGIIAAQGENTTWNEDYNVVGVSWNSKIMALKAAHDGADWLSIDAVVEAIRYTTMMRKRGVNVRISNNSYGGEISAAVYDAIVEHRDAGILFVAAAGNYSDYFYDLNNDTGATPIFPATHSIAQPGMAALDNIISVTGILANDEFQDVQVGAWHYGETSVHVAAPGAHIWSTFSSNGWGVLDGTSMATAFVSGIAALGLSVMPNAAYQTVKSAILDGVVHVTALEGITVTEGRANAYNTVSLLNEQTVVVGTNNDDTITALLEQPDLLVVRLNNVIQASGTPEEIGELILSGGLGNDTITVGADVLLPATLNGGAGNDSLTGGAGNDELNGDDGNDQLYGRDGWDTLAGGAGGDLLDGGSGDDRLTGGTGNDTLDGGSGLNKYFYAGSGLGTDQINETTAGTDELDFSGFAAALNINIANSGATAAVNQTDLVLYLGTSTLIENVVGTTFADTLRGNGGNNILTGGDGADSIYGEGGDDALWALAGNDTVYGGSGNDALYGDSGSDVLHGDTGNDTIYGDTGDDSLYGEGGSDTYVFDGGVVGEAREDLGTDHVYEAAAADSDTLDFRNFGQSIHVTLTNTATPARNGTGLVLWLDSATGIEAVQGTMLNDTIDGNSRGNVLWGNEGDDVLFGIEGGDPWEGGAGTDSLYGGDGSDIYWFVGLGLGTDTVYEDPNLDSDRLDFYYFGGYDPVYGEPRGHLDLDLDTSYPQAAMIVMDLVLYLNSNLGIEGVRGTNLPPSIWGYGDVIRGNARNNWIYGYDGDDTLVGRGGNDTLYGFGGDDVLNGDWDDTLHGAAGADVLYGGDGIDVADYSFRQNGVSLSIDNYSNDGEAGEGDNIRTDIEVIVGGAAGDTLNGSSGTEYCTLQGGGGNDYIVGTWRYEVLEGQGGNDTIQGVGGMDIIKGGDGDDLMYAYTIASNDSSPDSIEGNAGNDTIYGSNGNDTLMGDEDADIIFGNNGNDSILGGAGNDTLKGQLGNDTILGGNDNDYVDGEDTDAPGMSGPNCADYLDGEAGNDTLHGGVANDTLVGGSGSDRLYGEDGDDYLNAWYNDVDTVNGGNGYDTAEVDTLWATDWLDDYIEVLNQH